MRKLVKGDPKQKQGFPAARVIKPAGFVLFVLGMITLLALFSWYEYTAGLPGRSVVVTASELAAGGIAVKCAARPKYAKHVMIAAIALATAILLFIAFSGGAVQWPIIIGCCAACTLLACSIYNYIRTKKS